jgi:ribosomal protein L37AE/L43A
MSKPKRGKNIKATPNWRGTCPACGRTGVKLLWTKVNEDHNQQSVCKRCGN